MSQRQTGGGGREGRREVGHKKNKTGDKKKKRNLPEGAGRDAMACQLTTPACQGSPAQPIKRSTGDNQEEEGGRRHGR